ncbi:MAG: DNA repair protein RadC [Candidatus Omnitrophica bacterium]|nr:DNA repair protein RadC [Candidatus Omnitrophota bacterium]
MVKKPGQRKLYEKSIKNWPEDERPREKLLKFGEHTLSNTELIAILLRSGVKGQSAIDLSRKILSKFRTFRNMSHTDLRDWKEFKGLGQAKIAQIRAALEIGRRFREDEVKENQPKINSSKDIVDILMSRMRDLKKEVFKIVLLNSQNRIIDIFDTGEGTVNKANPIIREIFQEALQNYATSLICVHNHPSGKTEPSREDRDFTKELYQAGNIMQVKVLDHVIIGDNKYYSFADDGILGRDE